MNAPGDDGQLLFRYLTEVAIVAQLAGHALERSMGDGLTLPQFSVLNHLVRIGDGQNPVQLARAMQVAKGAMTKTLGHLKTKAYVAITPDARDGRAKLVEMTKAGRAAHAAAIAAAAPLLRHLATQVGSGELTASLPTIETLRKVLDAARDISFAPD